MPSIPNPPPFSLNDDPATPGGSAKNAIPAVHVVTPRPSSDDKFAMEVDLGPAKGGEDLDAALLLTSVAAIATKEVRIDGGSPRVPRWNGETPPRVTIYDPTSPTPTDASFPASLTPRFTHLCSMFETEYQHEKELEQSDTYEYDDAPYGSNNRLRAVSFDSSFYASPPSMPCDPLGCSEDAPLTSPQLVSPPSSPSVRPKNGRKPRRADRRKRYLDDQRSSSVASDDDVNDCSESLKHHKGTLQSPEKLKNRKVKTILRKKFSWKAYPELEAFLIANREEYLKHSALNYTVQQKQYNNKLTERLLELASEYGYAFDEKAFSFVTVRDRIRCYFKSYVQSSKKRGVVVGYAARRAGLIADDELERIACEKGKIVLPKPS